MALRTSIVDNDWKQPSVPCDPAVAGRQLIREVTEIDATVADSIVTTLNATPTVTNPVVDKATITGSFYISDLQSIAESGGAYPGSVTVRQKLTKITSVTNEASLPTKIRLSGMDILNAFALKSSTENFIADQWLYIAPASADTCRTLTLSATNIPTGYTEVRRRVDIEEKGDRTCTMSVLYKKAGDFTAWGGSPDIVDYYNIGSKSAQAQNGEGQGKIKTWLNIKKADQTTATADLLNGTNTGAADVGYVILKVDTRDNQDGSLTFQQVSEEQTAVTTDGQVIINALGLKPGTLDTKEAIYDNYTASDIGALSAPTVSGYTLVRTTTTPLGTWLYRRVYEFHKATWTNTVPTATVTAEVGAASEKAEHTANLQSYFGVPVASAEAFVQTLKGNTDDATYVTESVQFDDKGNGESVITRRRKKLNPLSAPSDYMIASLTYDSRTVRVPVGDTDVDVPLTGLWTKIQVYWPSLSPTTADALMAILAGGAGIPSDFAFNTFGITGTFKVGHLERSPQSSGVVRVDLVLVNDIYMGKWLANDGDKAIWKQEIRYIGSTTYRVTLGRRVTSSRTNAVDWANASTTGVLAGGRGQNSPAMKGGSIEWNDAEQRYIAYKETWTAANTYSTTP